MSAIVTITINPAIDKSTSVPGLAPHKKLRCSAPVFEPGGGGVNVARALKKLAVNATAIYFAGGYTGKFFSELLAREHIDAQPIVIASHTRENLIVVDNATNLQYRFGMPGPAITKNECEQLLSAIEELQHVEYIVASGSLAPGVPENIFANIAAIAKKKQAKFILDTSGEALKHALNEGVYLFKPNLSELSWLAGAEELDEQTAIAVAKDMIKKGNAEIIVISMGQSGAMLVTADMEKRIIAPVVKSKSTVGAGDSMVAGIVYSLYKGKDVLEAVQFGVACGTAATLNAGTELCKLTDAVVLFESMQRELLLR